MLIINGKKRTILVTGWKKERGEQSMRIISEKNYVDQAEKVMKELKQNGKEKKGKERSKNGDKEIRITTSKIRNILSMTINILNEVKEQFLVVIMVDICLELCSLCDN